MKGKFKNTETNFNPVFFTEDINANLIYGLNHTLGETIFVGPLRERSLKDDDVFSFNFPFVLGKMGELTGSFLGTFGNEVVDFPSPDYFDTKKTEKKSYLSHLSGWLNLSLIHISEPTRPY